MSHPRGALYIIFFLGFSPTSPADWLQDMTDQANRNLQMQRQGNWPPAGQQPSQHSPSGSGWPASQAGNPPVRGPVATVRWYVNCDTSGTDTYHRNNGVIRVGMPPFAYPNYKQMAGPFQSDATARNWLAANCPSWRCDWNGSCVGANEVGPQCPSGMVFQDAPFGMGKCVRR